MAPLAFLNQNHAASRRCPQQPLPLRSRRPLPRRRDSRRHPVYPPLQGAPAVRPHVAGPPRPPPLAPPTGTRLAQPSPLPASRNRSDLLWSDPMEDEDDPGTEAKFVHNELRGCSYTFSFQAVCQFLQASRYPPRFVFEDPFSFVQSGPRSPRASNMTLVPSYPPLSLRPTSSSASSARTRPRTRATACTGPAKPPSSRRSSASSLPRASVPPTARP